MSEKGDQRDHGCFAGSVASSGEDIHQLDHGTDDLGQKRETKVKLELASKHDKIQAAQDEVREVRKMKPFYF